MLNYDHLLQMLKEILDKHPEHRLDQCLRSLCEKANALASPMSELRSLHDQLDCRILAVQETPLQRNEEDIEMFNRSLLEVADHPEALLFVDEVREDMSMPQRKWTWG